MPVTHVNLPNAEKHHIGFEEVERFHFRLSEPARVATICVDHEADRCSVYVGNLAIIASNGTLKVKEVEL